MDEVISNQILFQKKLDDLSLFKKNLNPSTFKFSLNCTYHGINLHFKTHSNYFIEALKSHIPNEWITSSSEEGSFIFLKGPEEFGHTLESFSNEDSQDCLTRENNTVAIQRDFAATSIGKDTLLICEEDLSDGLYNFLRWYLSEKLMEKGTFVVHASCVLDKTEQAHLFLGHSGAGKTTITELSHPRLVLGDDMNLISIENGVLYVEAGAIGGRFNSMIGYGVKRPVKAVYWLEQASLNQKQKLNMGAASQKLLASFANLHWPTLSSEKSEKLLNFSHHAIGLAEFYQLRFKKDSSIWDYLDP